MERFARAALVALALASAGTAHAQRRPSITLGMAIAKREPYCTGCIRNTGVAALVNLSRFLNQTMAIGMESTLLLNNSGPATTALGSAMGAVTLWAVEGARLSVSGGLGFLVYSTGNAANATGTTSVGLGCSGRIGYETPVSSGFALVPYLGYMNSFGRLRVGPAEQVVNNLQIGMALRFR